MTYDLASLGWDASHAVALRRLTAGLEPARVLRADRGVCTVLGAAGPVRASLAGTVLATAVRDPAALPCPGDWVALRAWPDRRLTVEAVLPRRTAVVRRTAGKDASGQVLAANLDVAAVVEPLHPGPDPGRLERLLALAWESGAEPLIVLSKCDLAPDPAALVRQTARIAPEVEVLPVSALRGDGLAELRARAAAGRTLGLLGRSGAGKSSLVNALAGATVMGTRAIRDDGKGRHTTTYRALIPLPGGGAVLDTPGLRAVGLRDGATGLERAFADVAELASGCRFADCQHNGEPDCAVRAALDSGELTGRRWESWQKLRREVAHETRRGQARAVAARRRPDRRYGA